MATKKTTLQTSDLVTTAKTPKVAAVRKSPAAPKREKKVIKETAPEEKEALLVALTATPEIGSPVISKEAIAHRAYYLSEERIRSKKLGCPTQDWLEAEKQLWTELKPKR